MVEKLIEKGEDESQDFKQTISNLYKISKTIVSFANTNGGKLLIGVCDNKLVIGVDPEEEKYMLATAADHYCDPPVNLIFHEEEIEDGSKTVLIVQIEESTLKPHFAKQPDESWVAYIRVKDKSIPAGKSMLKTMKRSLTSSSQEKEAAIASLSKNERQLLDFLDLNDRATLKQVMKLQNLSKRRAARMLTDLVNKKILRIHEHEKEPFYTS